MNLLDVGVSAVIGNAEVSYCSGALGRQRGGTLLRLRSCHIRVGHLKQILGVACRKHGEQSKRCQSRRREPPIAQ
jgi:hypothetical protein